MKKHNRESLTKVMGDDDCDDGDDDIMFLG